MQNLGCNFPLHIIASRQLCKQLCKQMRPSSAASEQIVQHLPLLSKSNFANYQFHEKNWKSSGKFAWALIAIIVRENLLSRFSHFTPVTQCDQKRRRRHQIEQTDETKKHCSGLYNWMCSGGDACMWIIFHLRTSNESKLDIVKKRDRIGALKC